MLTLSPYARLAWLATLLAFVVVVFGAFVRLSNAGLSCPDWPTCYGKITWPKHETEIAHANATFPERPVETHKTWREQVHRMLAGGLVLTTFGLAFWAIRQRHFPAQPVGIPMTAAVLIVFQAILGWGTVAWKLKPIVVMAHLLGGMTTFWLLATIALRSSSLPPLGLADTAKLKRMVMVGMVLVACQIALGGWTSANYAALACGMDFPLCQGQWWPSMDFNEAFVLWRGIGINYEGGVLDASARTAIHLTHRIGALVVFGHLSMLAIFLWRQGTHSVALLLGSLLLLQIGLGISNVVFGLPLAIATAHNGVAALLMMSLLLVRIRLSPQSATNI